MMDLYEKWQPDYDRLPGDNPGLETILEIYRLQMNGQNYQSNLSPNMQTLEKYEKELDYLNLDKRGNKKYYSLNEEGRKLARKLYFILVDDKSLVETAEDFRSTYLRWPTKKELEQEMGMKISENAILKIPGYSEPDQEDVKKINERLRIIVRLILSDKLVEEKGFSGSVRYRDENQDEDIIQQEARRYLSKNEEIFDDYNISDKVEKVSEKKYILEVPNKLEDYFWNQMNLKKFSVSLAD